MRLSLDLQSSLRAGGKPCPPGGDGSVPFDPDLVSASRHGLHADSPTGTAPHRQLRCEGGWDLILSVRPLCTEPLVVADDSAEDDSSGFHSSTCQVIIYPLWNLLMSYI